MILENKDPALYILNEKNEMITREYIEGLLKRYGIEHKVKNIENYKKAMTHISYLRHDIEYYKTNKMVKYIFGKEMEEIKDTKNVIGLQERSYERLEFKGDAVIHHILGDYLYERYENEDEGFMTKLRTKIENSNTLASFTKIIGLNKYILISRHMEKSGSREKNLHMLEDVFESFMGALSIEAEYEKCYKFFVRLIEQEIDFASLLHTENNFKDILLQYFHKQKWQDPKYGTYDISGAEHKKIFTIYVKCIKNPTDDGEIVGVGAGTSKKVGEQEAARQALIYYEIIKEEEEEEEESSETISIGSDISNISEIEIIDDEEAENKNYNLE